MSKSYIKHKKDSCKEKRPIKFERKSRLACGSNGSTVNLLGQQGNTIDLVSVTIDLEDLINPLVKVDFSAIVEFEVDTTSPSDSDIDLDLQFTLSRICSDGVEQVLESYDYIRDFNVTDNAGTTTLIVRTTDPASFTFCDCFNSCADGPCSYIVRVLVISVDQPDVQIAQINDIFINAIAQGMVAC